MGVNIRGSRRPASAVAAGALAACLAVVPGAASANGGTSAPPPQPKIETIADGLVAPWGIDIGPWGIVFVAESGTGNIIKYWGDYTRVVANQPGVTDVAFDSTWSLAHVVGAGEPGSGTGSTFGRASLDGQVVTEASLREFEAKNNPDQFQTYGLVDPPANCPAPPELASYKGLVDSNAYGVLALDDGTRLVADAAGNTILNVGQDGAIDVVAVLPPVKKTLPAEIQTDEGSFPLPACLAGATYLAEPVPTAVVKGPDGWLYVSGLTGVPETPGTGVVFRVNPSTGEATLWQDGLTTAVDLAFDHQGRLWVAEVFGGDPTAGPPGALVRIDTAWTSSGLTPTTMTTVATGADGVVTPLGVAVADWGDVYVTVGGLPQGDGPPAATGAVLKLSGY